MKTRTLGLFVLPFALLVARASDAAPSVVQPTQPAQPAPRVGPAPKLKQITKLTMTGAAGVPGEAKVLEATLGGPNSSPVAGKKVTFTIEPKNGSKVPANMAHAGEDTTDAQGKAHLKWTVPELASANYNIQAKWAGDEEHTGSVGDGNLYVAKGLTKIELSNLLWGYKDEEAAAFSVQLKRTIDGTGLGKKVTVSVTAAGKPTQTWDVDLTGYAQLPLSPISAAHWKVVVTFNGDDVYAPFSIEKTYVHPAK